MLIAVLIGLQTAAAVPPVTVMPKGDGFRAEAATFNFGQSAAVHAEIERRASELCAGEEVKWGEFGSLAELGKNPGSTPPKISGYYQEFRCIVSETLTHVELPNDWKPTAADESDVRRILETYYAARDAGQFDAAAAMFEPGVQEGRSIEHQHEFNRKLGPGKRRIAAVTWYVNRPDAPRPGAYAALDFVGDYPNLHVYCGYLMLYRRGPGKYEIIREEQSIFERGDTTADMNQVAAMRSASCREN